MLKNNYYISKKTGMIVECLEKVDNQKEDYFWGKVLIQNQGRYPNGTIKKFFIAAFKKYKES